MDLILEGIQKAFSLLISLDPDVLGITGLSLMVSGAATFISLFLGISTGMVIALTNFPGKRFVISLINTGMGLPPVVVGLFVSIFLWRNGPFGFLEILYTPLAIVIAQAIIATPIVMGISLAALQNLPKNLRLQILSLGATRLQMIWILMKEARLPLLAAVMAGFGGVISEVGASIMVGGNIKGYTRVLTTATVMETGKGNFDVAIALGIILMLLSLLSTPSLHRFNSDRGRDDGERAYFRGASLAGLPWRGDRSRYCRSGFAGWRGRFPDRTQWCREIFLASGPGPSDSCG